jgi:hypothetical protein
MTIDITAEQLIPLSEAADRIPRRRRGRKTAVSTLYRWADKGVRGVVLETLQCGGSLCTSMPALQRYFDRLSTQRTSQASRGTSVKADVEAALDNEGI